MKCRCPYCHEVRTWTQRHQCPHCGKSVLPADFKRITASRRARREAREQRRSTPWMTGGIWEMFVARSRATRWVLGFGVLAVVGALMQAPHQKQVSNDPGAIELAQDNMFVLSIALGLFRDDCGRYPTTAEGLTALLLDPGVAGWHGPYIDKLKPDPWGVPFRYASDGGTVTLFSVGADGKAGTADDLQPPGANARPAGEAPVEVEIRGGNAPAADRGKAGTHSGR